MSRMSEKDYKCAADEFYESLKRKKTSFMEIDEQEEHKMVELLSEVDARRCIGKTMGNFYDRMLASNIRLSEKIYEFYKEKAPKISVEREDKLRHGDAFLIGNRVFQMILLTGKPLRENDFIAYSHELGHYPDMKEPVDGEYFDFIEAFPLLLEFYACQELDKESVLETFKKYRLKDFKRFALSNIEIEKEKKYDGSNRDRYLEALRKENCKFFTSLELALGLLDRIESDRDFTISELEAYVNREKSMREVSESLDIDTTEYRRLIKFLPKK